VSVSRFWRAKFLFHVEYMYYSYVEIEYVATSFSPARMDLALKLLSNLPFWSDDAIMTSPALLTDAVLTSFELLAILVGVAFIRLGGVELVFLMVSPNFMTFLVLPNPTPYSE
jgi:hypothetical protein